MSRIRIQTLHHKYSIDTVYHKHLIGSIRVMSCKGMNVQDITYSTSLFLQVWFEYLAFKVVFIIAYLVLAVYFSFEMYYRFKFGLKLDSCKELYKMHKQGKFWRIQHPVSVQLFVIITAIMLLILLTVQVFYTSDLPRRQCSRVSSYVLS